MQQRYNNHYRLRFYISIDIVSAWHCNSSIRNGTTQNATQWTVPYTWFALISASLSSLQYSLGSYRTGKHLLSVVYYVNMEHTMAQKHPLVPVTRRPVHSASITSTLVLRTGHCRHIHDGNCSWGNNISYFSKCYVNPKVMKAPFLCSSDRERMMKH